MANVTIAVDTDGRINPLGSAASTKNLGLLAAISLTSRMTNAVADGYGTGHHRAQDKTKRLDIPGNKKDLLDNGCDVIATVGGLFLNSGISGTGATVPFVSMAGSVPQSPDPYCRGGVSLETRKLNLARRDFLITRKSLTSANIYLYRDGMSDAKPGETPGQPDWEKSDWGANFVNYSGDFNKDLNVVGAGSVPATAEGLVIAASPLFLTDGNMSALVAAANTWLKNPPSGKTRYGHLEQ
jgi:hypothetical protein